MINSDEITETDRDSIPTGNFTKIEGTLYDLRKMQNLGEQIQQLLPATTGYDDNYCFKTNNDSSRINIIAK